MQVTMVSEWQKVEDALQKGSDNSNLGMVLKDDQLMWTGVLCQFDIIGNEMDLTLVEQEGLLFSDFIMLVSVTASSTSGKSLREATLNKRIDEVVLTGPKWTKLDKIDQTR
uniref:Uncharacterized protein n=1 Tax=Quercus lobata TaxID=97700 RepID=A0A7N2L9J1_QUELO